MRIKAILVHVIAFLNFMAVFHELAHALTALYFGWKVRGIHFTPFVSWVEISVRRTPPLWERLIVYGSGGLVAGLIFGLLILYLRRNYQLFTWEEKYFIYFSCGWSFIYAIVETIFLGVLAWKFI